MSLAGGETGVLRRGDSFLFLVAFGAEGDDKPAWVTAYCIWAVSFLFLGSWLG